VRNLFERGLSAATIRALFRLIDWVITLPPELVQQFRHELSEMEEQNQMPYVTSIKVLAKEEGLQLGLAQGLEEGRKEGVKNVLKNSIRTVLQLRFHEAGLRLMPEVDVISDAEQLQTIFDQAAIVSSLDELRVLWK
jgi:flagellar biosynthesis/type III secretory pathway protein FliH